MTTQTAPLDPTIGAMSVGERHALADLKAGRTLLRGEALVAAATAAARGRHPNVSPYTLFIYQRGYVNAYAQVAKSLERTTEIGQFLQWHQPLLSDSEIATIVREWVAFGVSEKAARR